LAVTVPRYETNMEKMGPSVWAAGSTWTLAVRNRRWALAGLGLALIVPGALLAEDRPPKTLGKPLILFDGKSLEGWAKTKFYSGGDVKVEDGSIVLTQSPGMTGITTTRKDLPTTNYELTYEAMRLSGEDFFAAATFPVAKSFITFVNGGWHGTVTGLSSLNGSDASENETTTFVKFENKTWYTFRVCVTDASIRCWIDDKKVVSVNIENVEIRTRIEVRANQPLGFATYESGGALRKIAVRPLTAEEIASTNKDEK
jgi:Domain of Unknown Function (DUF1080)